MLAIHGGAGSLSRKKLTPEVEKAYHDDLERALREGSEALHRGGTSVDAVEAATKRAGGEGVL